MAAQEETRMNNNSQAILILCSRLCVGDGIEPLKPSEWKKVASNLLNKKLTPGDILGMSADEIKNILGCDEEYSNRIMRLIGRSASLFFEISKYENIGISVITRADEEYPKRIKQKLGDSCPPFFYYSGDLSLLNKRGVGFVGSRTMEGEDIDFEGRLVKEAVKERYAIISGGARGADSVSEKFALGKGGRMVEFLADSMIKKMHDSDIVKAVQNGRLLLLSVVNPEAGFSVGSAMERNKFIYAQSDVVIAIKSIKQGGTWSGVLDNLKHNYCPVLCWDNKKYKDNTEMIKRGAIAIDEKWSIKDIPSIQGQVISKEPADELTEKQEQKDEQLRLF